jgi:hypothetical protein
MSDEHVGPRTAYARKAFAGHFDREPTEHIEDRCWITGYVAALEDLPDELLGRLEIGT